MDYGNARAVSEVLIDFKTQVQEWKNILIRGKNPEQLEKHWTAFQKHEHDVVQATKKLHGALTNGDARELVDQFAQAHIKMGEDYRKGYADFKAASFDSAVG